MKSSRRQRSQSEDCLPISVLKCLSNFNFEVFLIEHHLTNKFYAMKVFPNLGSSIHPCFMREARVMDLSHPNLIQMKECRVNVDLNSRSGHIQKKVCYILMEYAIHGDLSELIWGRRLPNDEKLIRTIFRFICEGVYYLHSKGFAHTELKPENILLADNFVPKLCDFDSMILVNNFERLATRGTKNFRAPEIQYYECSDPFAADVYSLGVILFALQTGELPYKEDNVEKQKEFQNGEEKFWAQVAKEKLPEKSEESFKALVKGMTNRVPEKRWNMRKVMESKWYKGEIYNFEDYVELMDLGDIPDEHDENPFY